MIRQYNLNKIAGPSGTFAGYVLLVFGIITTIFTISGIIVLILGLYLAFGHFCSAIDSEKRRVRLGIKLFRWALSGKWIDVDDTYKTEIRKVKGIYTVYSASNRELDLEQTYYKIFVYRADHTKRIAVAQFNDLGEAQKEIETIRELLKIQKLEE